MGVNPQIANPHLIYPGDRLTLVFIDGEPRLVVKKHVKKNVEGRIEPKGGAVPAVDLSLINNYLVQNRIVDSEWVAGLPMIMSGESPSRFHTMGDVVYVNEQLPLGLKVAIYEEGREFFHKETTEPLGQEIILASSGRVIESGSVSKVKLLSNLRETRVGFRVTEVDDGDLLPAFFMPQSTQVTDATVMAIEKNTREAGQYDVVYLDKGKDDGVASGHVFGMYQGGEDIVINADGKPVRSADRTSYDKVKAHFSEDDVVKMPDIYQGNLMVFKVFDKTSMGLIMLNHRPVREGDKLTIPTSVKLKGD